MKDKTTVLLTGQVFRNLYTHSLKDILEYHELKICKSNFVCHLWKEEFDKINEAKSRIPNHVHLISDNDEVPFNAELMPFVNQKELAYHGESIRISNCQEFSDLSTRESFMQSAFTSLKQIYALNQAVNYALNFDSDIYIRSRYDNYFLNNLDLQFLMPYLNTSRPVIFVPKFYTNASLIDNFFVTNRSGLECFKNYFDDCRSYSLNYRVFWAENSFRFHINNIKKMILYRFDFPNGVQRYVVENGRLHAENFEFLYKGVARDIKKFDRKGLRSGDYVI